MKNLFVALSLALLVSTAASAQNNRSFVSTTGSDANACTPGNECRSFTRALAVTNPGGDVIALTSGGYGTFTVAQAVTVMSSPGVIAAITVTTGNGIDVATGSFDLVVLRGLSINAVSTPGDGILATGFGTLSIEGCSVNGGSIGIVVEGPNGSHASLTDTVARAGQTLGFGLAGSVVMLRCRAESNATGLQVQSSSVDAKVSAIDLVSIGNGSTGVFAFAAVAGHSAVLDLDRAVVSENGADGIFADGGGLGTLVVRVANSSVTENSGRGLLQTGTATFNSMNNNFVAGNTLGDTGGAFGTVPVH